MGGEGGKKEGECEEVRIIEGGERKNVCLHKPTARMIPKTWVD